MEINSASSTADSNDDAISVDPGSHTSDGSINEQAINDVIDTVLNLVTRSLSSDLVQDATTTAVDEKVIQHNLKIAKRRSEIEGLRRAITNAVNRGSCGIEKLAVIDAAIEDLLPDPIRPEEPRDPTDRRKRLRSSCFRYVSQQEVSNSLKALRHELKLPNTNLIGLGLTQVFSALESSLDKPFDETWSGVSHIYNDLMLFISFIIHIIVRILSLSFIRLFFKIFLLT